MLIALHLENLVADLGHRSIDLASTESEAVDRALDRPPSIILSDVRLSEGTGPAAVRTIRDALGPIPVVYITGNPDACPHDPGTPVLAKPIQDRLLSDTIQSILSPACLEAGQSSGQISSG